MEPILILSLAFAVASAVLFALVARTVHRREVSREARPARNAFVTWWACLSFLSLVGGILVLPGIPADVPLFLEATIASLLVLCVGLWGLLFYLVYLYTSDRRSRMPLAAAYVGVFGLLLFFILRQRPDHIESTRWGPMLGYAARIDGGFLFWVVVVLVLVPPFLAAAAYLSLYRKTRDPLQRRRILLVGLSIALWFGTSLGVGAANVGVADWWQVASRLISLAAAATVYYAYAGLRPGREEPPAPMPPAPAPYLAGDPFDPKGRVARVVPLT